MELEYQSFSEALIAHTCANSNFQRTRNYISLSHVHLSVDELVKQYKQGFPDSQDIRLKCYKGYQMERDLLERIKAVCGDRIVTGTEISCFDGLVKGHPDYTFDGSPGECKSVLMDEWLPKDGKLPRRIYWQLQGYMLYSNKSKAIVLFESRENGRMVHLWVNQNTAIQKQIDANLKLVIAQIK
jgi:hypothetical protein